MISGKDSASMTLQQYETALDSELLDCMEQDEEAFNELYRRYHRLVYYIAYGMCKNDADAKDIVQETFIKVKRSAKDIRDKNSFKAWLNTVTISSCKDLFKKNKYGNIDSDNMYAQSHIKEERRYLLPEKQMHFETDQQLLDYYISKLPDNQSTILRMQYFDNMSLHDIANTLGLSEGTVKSRIHYAKDTLRGYIEKHNRNKNNKPLDFNALDAIFPGILVGASIAPTKRLSFKKKLWSGNFSLTLGSLGVACTVASVVGVGGYMALQNQKTADTSSPIVMRQKQENVNSKELYFHLMDWAANKEDMEIKTAQEIEEVRPMYEQLKQRNDAYFELLKIVNWVSNYEEMLVS